MDFFWGGWFSLIESEDRPFEKAQRTGDQAGGCVFLYMDDIYRDVKTMRDKGMKFREVPRKESYGTAAVFEDLYGNRWDLIQSAPRQ